MYEPDPTGLFTPAAPFSPRREEVVAPSSVKAPLRRAQRQLRVIPADPMIELRNSDLQRMNTDYLANMAEAAAVRDVRRAPVLARRNAEHWVLGVGIGGIGPGIGAAQIPGPLSIFQGTQLLDLLTGVRTMEATGRKRAREKEEEDQEEAVRRVRAREESEDIRRRAAEDGENIGMGLGFEPGDEPEEMVRP